MSGAMYDLRVLVARRNYVIPRLERGSKFLARSRESREKRSTILELYISTLGITAAVGDPVAAAMIQYAVGTAN